MREVLYTGVSSCIDASSVTECLVTLRPVDAPVVQSSSTVSSYKPSFKTKVFKIIDFQISGSLRTISLHLYHADL